MKEKEDTTSARIKISRKMKLEQIAIEVGYITKKPYKWTDILSHLIDHYANDAKQDIVHHVINKEEKNNPNNHYCRHQN